MKPLKKVAKILVLIFGHLVPRKGSPPVLKPGESETVKIPFIGTDKESEKILVMVKTVSVD
jgi:hypothetical protein